MDYNTTLEKAKKWIGDDLDRKRKFINLFQTDIQIEKNLIRSRIGIREDLNDIEGANLGLALLKLTAKERISLFRAIYQEEKEV